MILDERVVSALAEIVKAGNTHQRACLIGGQALRDLYDALRDRVGPDVPAVRASNDVDLLLSVGTDPEADRALHSVLQRSWIPKPDRPATYLWKSDRGVELDLVTTYGADDEPARAVKISLAGTGRILAYRMIPAWLHNLNLMEPCHGIPLRNIGLERLRHTALLVSKVLAVDACLAAMVLPEPPVWTSRLGRDIEDVLYLTNLRLRQGLWCAACSAKRADLHQHLDPIVDRIKSQAATPPKLDKDTLDRLLELVDALPGWWK